MPRHRTLEARDTYAEIAQRLPDHVRRVHPPLNQVTLNFYESFAPFLRSLLFIVHIYSTGDPKLPIQSIPTIDDFVCTTCGFSSPRDTMSKDLHDHKHGKSFNNSTVPRLLQQVVSGSTYFVDAMSSTQPASEWSLGKTWSPS